MEFVKEFITIHGKPIAVITMNGDTENSLTKSSLLAFKSVLEKIMIHQEADGIIITSNKEAFFSNGLNLTNLINTPKDKLVGELVEIIEFFYFLLKYPLPVISEINGHALAGGGHYCPWH